MTPGNGRGRIFLLFLKYFENILLRYSQQPRDCNIHEFYQGVTGNKNFH